MGDIRGNARPSGAARARVIAVALGLFVAVGLGGSAVAHDYVLLPEPSRLSDAGAVTLQLLVGDGLVFELERGFEVDRVARFEHFTREGARDLAAGRASEPAPLARVALDAPGGHLFALDRPPTDITLPAAKFTRYLRHERLVDVLAERAERRESRAPGRERYSRSLKAFVQVGALLDGVGLRETGQALELVFEADPGAVRAGDWMPFRLLEEGQPRARHPVDALVRVAGRVHRTALRTDAEGRGRVRLDHAGLWVLRAISMRRCERCEDVDWTSRWTSFAFGVPTR